MLNSNVRNFLSDITDTGTKGMVANEQSLNPFKTLNETITYFKIFLSTQGDPNRKRKLGAGNFSLEIENRAGKVAGVPYYKS